MLFNVKVSEELMGLITLATELSGAATKSEWARDALEAGARAEVTRASVVARKRKPGGGFRTAEGRCTHPPQGWVRRPFDVVCGVCGKKVYRA